MLRLRAERGSSAVEFAIVASLLFMILFGTVQFGIAYNRYQGLNAAAREGARLASVGGTYTDVFNRTAESTSVIDTSTCSPATCSPCPGGGPTSAAPFCVSIAYVTSANALVNLTSATAIPPCDTAAVQNPANATVVVTAKYFMRIQIPLFGTFTPVVTGDGRFRCER